MQEEQASGSQPADQPGWSAPAGGDQAAGPDAGQDTPPGTQDAPGGVSWPASGPVSGLPAWSPPAGAGQPGWSAGWPPLPCSSCICVTSARAWPSSASGRPLAAASRLRAFPREQPLWVVPLGRCSQSGFFQ